MMFHEWASSQFEVTRINDGKNKGKVCFKTPCFNYVVPYDVWESVKQKINEV